MGEYVGHDAKNVPWSYEAALRTAGVESPDDLIARTAALFEELRQAQPEHVLLVGHSSSIHLLGRLAGLSTEMSQVQRGGALKLL